MDGIVLSRVGGILGPFACIFGLIMNSIYDVLDLVGIQNVALTIIIFTLISDLLMLPLTIKQQKFTRVSSLVQPEIQKIQKKYKGKTDELSQRRMQAETMDVYNKYGASPSAGCLPMLISFPIMLALYRIIYNIPSYVESIGNLFLTIANPISQVSNGASIMEGLMENLNIAVSGFDFANIDKIIDVLNSVKTTQWPAVAEAFAGHPEVVDAINSVKDTIIEVNAMPGGLNVMDAPVHFSQGISGIFPGILIPILAGVTQYLSVKVTAQKNTNTGNPEQDQMASSMKTMNIMMPLISVWICFTLPAGVGLYWICNAVFRTIFSVLINRYYSKKDITELTKASAEKIAAQSEKRAAALKEFEEKNPSKARNAKMSDIAKGNHSKKDYTPNYNKSDEPVNTSSIASVAHMLDRNKKDE